MSDYKLNYVKKELPRSLGRAAIAIMSLGALLVILAFVIDPSRASFNSIINFMFVLSIGLGTLFLTGLEYIVGAVWSVPFRRISEILAATLFFVPVLAIPVLLNMHGVFHWTHHEAVEADAILSGKAPYLNETFFLIRFIVIFIVIWLFYKIITGRSQKQDLSGDQNLTRKNIRTSAAMMPVFGISITILAVDWLMSLEPHWFSTIFGVYYFAGTVLAALSALSLFVINLDKKGYLSGITKDHYYNLGALMFAFTNFWAYIAFSQFLLIWYANIPEETFWFIHRGEGSWLWLSIGMIVIHFVVPYALLLSQPAKSNIKVIKFTAIWLLFAHLYDLYWLVMPNFSKEGAVFGWIEIVFPIFSVGLVLTVFYFAAKKKNLMAVGDPKMQRAMEFHL